MKKAMLKWTIAVLMCGLLTSCGGNNSVDIGTDSEVIDGGGAGTETIVPGDFAEGDISYTLEISDGKRSVVLSVSRKNGVTDGKITYPERLNGTSVISDAGGVRLIPPNGEILGLTEESAEGIRAFFDVMGREPSDADKRNEGMYSFELGSYEVVLLLSSEGMPRLITLTRDGYTRHGEVKMAEK